MPIPKSSLILFSGGVDSTYVLAQKLRETDEIIIAHHIHLVNSERRHKAEAEACKRIVEFCKREYRDFFYVESAVDRRKFRVFGYDVITVAFEGGIAASNFLIDTGRMPDTWMMGINQEEMDEVSIDTGDRLKYILASMAASCYPNKPPKYVRPDIHPKAELIAYMGEELTSLCWTCRRPVKTEQGFEPCGKCKTCLLMGQ